MYSINICHLYPELTNSYGDRGNIFVLKKRCEWRNIEVNIHNISIGDMFVLENYDIVFFGSSQKHEKQIILNDFIGTKCSAVKNAVEDNLVFLCIGGGYQIMGKKLVMSTDMELNCSGILDVTTVNSNKRLTGHLIFECSFLKNSRVVSFENHSSKTYLGSDITPLGRVIHGYGNNGEDGSEGAIYKNVYCSYGHGSLLPRNPELADHLITLALKRKYPDFIELTPLDDTLENIAHHTIEKEYELS